jgi:hypothetical protein
MEATSTRHVIVEPGDTGVVAHLELQLLGPLPTVSPSVICSLRGSLPLANDRRCMTAARSSCTKPTLFGSSIRDLPHPHRPSNAQSDICLSPLVGDLTARLEI